MELHEQIKSNLQEQRQAVNQEINFTEHEQEFYNQVMEELKKQNAENTPIPKQAILNAVKLNRKPEDVAWALLQ